MSFFREEEQFSVIDQGSRLLLGSGDASAPNLETSNSIIRQSTRSGNMSGIGTDSGLGDVRGRCTLVRDALRVASACSRSLTSRTVPMTCHRPLNRTLDMESSIGLYRALLALMIRMASC